MSKKIQLLDCTLRDGGYINEWKWGFHIARSIIALLLKSQIEIVEVGFLRNVEEYDEDITVCNKIEDLNKLLPQNNKTSMFSAMIMASNYDIDALSAYDGEGIEMIRITAHDYDIEEGLNFAGRVKEKGYKVCVNPINIMGYSDEKLLKILKKVNEIHPYQFSIVDTFGSMKRRDLDRIVSLVDNNLDRDIQVGLHLHENMSLSCCLVQNFVDKNLDRTVVIDGSLMGMGRNPGNLPLELISDYLNDYADKRYEIDYIMDAIYDYIAPIKGKSEWGYSPVFFLSARFNLHRNYAEYLLNKGDLTHRDINHILSRVEDYKKTVFDQEYIEQLYIRYNGNKIDDSSDRKKLKERFESKKILVLAPGATILEYRGQILSTMEKEKPICISVNFIPEHLKVDYAFFSNNRRLQKIDHIMCTSIFTSNLDRNRADFYVDYNSVSGAFSQGCNSLIMMLKLLKDVGVSSIMIAGADGYTTDGNNYYNSELKSAICRDDKFNMAVAEAIEKIGINIEFITPSKYETYRKR